MKNINRKRIVTLAVASALAVGVFAGSASAAWETDGSAWKYSQSGKYMVNRFVKLDGDWYHFDANGVMSTGWLATGGKWYYLNTDGKMATGWTKVEDKWYSLDDSGAMRTGWAQIGSNWYFLDRNGVMITGTVQIDGKDYSFGETGVLGNQTTSGYSSAAYTAKGEKAAIVDPVKDGTTASVVIPEGYSAAQIGNLLEKNGICRKEAFLKALNAYQPTSQTFQAFYGDNTLFYYFEGMLYPDTYEFYRYDDPANVIKKMLINFDNKVASDAELLKKIEEKGGMKKILTIASIIQEESSKAEDMAKVSAVIWNRLADPKNYPTLGFNPTTEYMKNQMTPNWSTGNPSVDPKSYDTYQIAGLPAGPIDNPGRQAILAALNPEAGFMDTFFCTDKEGTFYFAKTYAEHQKNIELVKQKNALLDTTGEPKALSYSNSFKE